MADKIEVEIEPSVSSSGLAKLRGALGSAMSGLGQGTGALAAAHGPAGFLSGAGLPGAGAALGAVQSFVSKANPAIVEQLMEAFEDIQGVVGQALLPIIESLIPVVRMYGDILASILPDQEQMRKLMAALQPALDELRKLWVEMAPGIKAVVDIVIDLLVPALQFLVEALVWVAEKIKYINPAWLGAQALGTGATDFAKSGVGAAGRQVSFTAIGELGKQLQAQAFGAGVSPAERTAKATEEIGSILKGGLEFKGGEKGFSGAGGSF